MSARHGPNRFSSYRRIHDTVMSTMFDRGIVCATALLWSAESGAIRLTGEIACLGNIVLRVDKTLEVLDGASDPLVHTVDYAYNAHVRDYCNFLRYDNAHRQPGHPTDNHRHEFNWRTGDELPGSPRCLGDDWPTLGEVITEVGDWRWSHYDDLPSPDACPLLNLRD